MRALEPFAPSDGPIVASWVRELAEARAWASLDRLPDAAMLARWHEEADVHPFVARDDDGRPIAYGELWEDADEDEAELARVLVAPRERGQGIGRWLTRALADEAHRRGFSDVWLRVMPDNERAIRAYQAAGFDEASPAEADAFNAGLPTAYRWFRDGTGTAPEVTGPQPSHA